MPSIVVTDFIFCLLWFTLLPKSISRLKHEFR